MTLWFMFDNHTFARVEGDRATMTARARELFQRDGTGVLFMKNLHNRTEASLLGRRLPDGSYGVTEDQLHHFFDRVEEFENWECR